MPGFWLVAHLSVTLHIVDLWQYFVCYTRSDVSRCTLFMVLYLGRMCQSVLHVVLWSHIGFLMRLLAADPRSTAGLLFPRVGSITFCWPSCSLPFCHLLFFPFSSFLLWVGIVALGSLDWMGVNCSLPALHSRPFLIIIIKWQPNFQEWLCLQFFSYLQNFNFNYWVQNIYPLRCRIVALAEWKLMKGVEIRKQNYGVQNFLKRLTK